ncbi:MAG: anaerobic ribonucleoside-triphosphate reductase activating protein [Candidatus Paceibacteria bacterium]
MNISGVQQFTTLDFPGRIACIIFTAGCNFRCGFCHNPEFVLPEKIQKIQDTFISKDAVFNFLESREGLLEGVVISGGEPTMQPDLLDFITKIRNEFDYEIKLDSNGNRPEILQEAIEKNLLDYIAMDIKQDFEDYQNLVGGRVNTTKMQQSIDLLKQERIEYEFRTTLIKGIHTRENLENIADLISGAENYYLQEYRNGHTLDPDFVQYDSFSNKEMKQIKQIFEDKVNTVQIRD